MAPDCVFRLDRENWLGTNPEGAAHAYNSTASVSVRARASSIAVHITSHYHWRKIWAEGIRCTQRRYVRLVPDHMARGEVLITVDLTAANARGVPMHRAEGGVVLARGDIPPTCFVRVVDGRTGASLSTGVE